MAKKKSHTPKIGLVSFNISHGLPYQRLHLPFQHLRKRGYDIECFDLENLRHADAFYCDALVFSHPWSPVALSIVEQARYHYNIPAIIDIDDLVSELPTDHPDYGHFQAHKLPHIIQAASFVSYSTSFLAQHLGHLNRNHAVIPNSINRDVWGAIAPQNKPYKNAFIVGWTGGQSHRSDQLYTFLPGLMKFLDTHPDAKAYFHVLCPDILPKRYGAQVIFEPQPVNFLDYPAVASAYPFDVCLVGLTDNAFNNAKSDLKLLEMAPIGVPLIASPRSDFIQHKDRDIMMFAEDGNDKHYDWYDQLCWAYDNQKEVREMGCRARDYVLAERTSVHAADKWEEVLKKCLG